MYDNDTIKDWTNQFSKKRKKLPDKKNHILYSEGLGDISFYMW